MTLDEFIIDVFLRPFSGNSYVIYIPIQIIALLTTFLFLKRRIIRCAWPLVCYMFGLIIGHMVYVATMIVLIMNCDFM